MRPSKTSRKFKREFDSVVNEPVKSPRHDSGVAFTIETSDPQPINFKWGPTIEITLSPKLRERLLAGHSVRLRTKRKKD